MALILVGVLPGWTAAADSEDVPNSRRVDETPAVESGEEPGSTSLADALGGGTPAVTFRYRYEFVSDKTFALDAHASTLRTTLGYETAPYRGVSLLLEAENVRPIGNDLYDNLGSAHRNNGRFDRPVVAGPGPDANQPGRVAIGDRRGHTRHARSAGDSARRPAVRRPVGWRQNQQSFDAARIETDVLPRGRFNYALVRNAHRITGAIDPLTGHLLHASFGTRGASALIVYAHALDYERDRHRSTATVGAELTGQRSIGDTAFFVYEVEAARQRGSFRQPDVGGSRLRACHSGCGVSRRHSPRRLGTPRR